MRTFLFPAWLAIFLLGSVTAKAQLSVSEPQSKAQSELTLANQSTASLLNALSTSSFSSGTQTKREKATNQINQSKQLSELKTAFKSALGLVLPGKWRSDSERNVAMQAMESARSTKEWGKSLTQIESALRADAFNGFWKTQRSQWIQSLQRL